MALDNPKFHHLEGLPLSLVGPVDLGRLIRELDTVDDNLESARLRGNAKEVKLPKTSHMLDEIVDLNKLDLSKRDDRRLLKDFLETIKEHAPHIHMSFSADPAPAFTAKMVQWLRRELHPVLLITVGLQPGIGAGCIVRTANKYFDLSISKDFQHNRDLLMAQLRAAPDPAPQAVIPQPAATVVAVPVLAAQSLAAPARAAAPHAKEVHA